MDARQQQAAYDRVRAYAPFGPHATAGDVQPLVPKADNSTKRVDGLSSSLIDEPKLLLPRFWLNKNIRAEWNKNSLFETMTRPG